MTPIPIGKAPSLKLRFVVSLFYFFLFGISFWIWEGILVVALLAWLILRHHHPYSHDHALRLINLALSIMALWYAIKVLSYFLSWDLLFLEVCFRWGFGFWTMLSIFRVFKNAAFSPSLRFRWVR